MKRKIRLVFVFVILFFFVVFAISLKIDQPYPAIIYPSFGNIPIVTMPIKKPGLEVFFNNHDSLSVNTADFFYQLRSVFRSTILTANFTKESSFLNPVKKSKGLNSNLSASQKNEKIEKGISWIKMRLAEITNRTDFDRLEVQWHKYSFKENTLVSDTLVEKFIVDLK